mmetsp:Transcript_2046/g.4755  ORF Transcript_2046/g.4755 Transcript_2046/m.4755 type:complete len:186 (+) Transcript_2046:68-625(+)
MLASTTSPYGRLHVMPLRLMVLAFLLGIVIQDLCFDLGHHGSVPTTAEVEQAVAYYARVTQLPAPFMLTIPCIVVSLLVAQITALVTRPSKKRECLVIALLLLALAVFGTQLHGRCFPQLLAADSHLERVVVLTEIGQWHLLLMCIFLATIGLVLSTQTKRKAAPISNSVSTSSVVAPSLARKLQ